VKWIRYFPSWISIEREGPGQFTWENADARVANAKENGIQVSGMLTFFPLWASADGKSPRANPVKDIKYWENFAEQAMTRYREDIRWWEVWNEFNSGAFAKSKDKPKDYAGLVAGAKRAAKRVDPGIKVGISCANFDLNFFAKSIKAGAAGHFDFVCVHPYENMHEVMRGGGEPGFLSMAASIRKMLKENGEDPGMPLWITEIGYKALNQPDAKEDSLQADALVKCFTLSIAQGFAVVEWFEARGPKYGKQKNQDFGLIRHDWTKRPSWHAYKQMTTTLGEYPEVIGWLALGEKGKGYGFVFKGAGGQPVMVAWAPEKDGMKVSFPAAVTVTPINGKPKQVAANAAHQLPWSPSYVTDLPEAMVSTAQANRGKPFPWGGNFAEETVVRHVFGANTNLGLDHNTDWKVQIVNDLTSTHALTLDEKGKLPNHINFRAHPSFVNAANGKYEITAVVRRKDNKPSKIRVYFYESENGYKRLGKPVEVKEGDEWQEISWTVDDANFVGQWGYNFCFAFQGGKPMLMKEVRLKRLP